MYLTVLGGPDSLTPVTPVAYGTAGGGDSPPYVFLDFDPTSAATDVLVLRVATSFISASQAVTTHKAQVDGMQFDDVKAASAAIWRATLSVVDIVDVGSTYTPQQQHDMLVVFYSSLYRCVQQAYRVLSICIQVLCKAAGPLRFQGRCLNSTHPATRFTGRHTIPTAPCIPECCLQIGATT